MKLIYKLHIKENLNALCDKLESENEVALSQEQVRLYNIFVEVIFELIGYCYIKLMQLAVPDKKVSEKTKKTIRNIATTFAALLAIVLIIGLILIIQDDPFINNIGKYMTYIPLAIMALQVLVGISVKIVGHFKKK